MSYEMGIVILNYNTWEQTLQLIGMIKSHCNFTKMIYVVDNNSQNKPSEEILNYLTSESEIKLIMHPENKGYAAGNNVGIKLALEDDCEFVAICNSDIKIIDNSFDKIIGFLRKNKDKNIGLAGPTIFNKDDKFEPFHMMVKLTASGKIKLLFAKTPLSFLSAGFEKKFYRNEPLEKPTRVFSVIGCCFVMTRECAEFLYPLDENTFLYEEEYIIGCRLENSKFKAYIIPDTHIIHAHGGSVGKISEFSYNCLVDSEQYYLREYVHDNAVICSILKLIRRALWKFKYRK